MLTLQYRSSALMCYRSVVLTMSLLYGVEAEPGGEEKNRQRALL